MSSAQQYMRELPSHSFLEHSILKNYKQNFKPPQTTGKGQARRQDVVAGGAKHQKGCAHFLNTVLDVCSNRWAKREMGGHRF